MNAKGKVDALMTLALLFLMGYPFWGEVAHEWAGAGLSVLFLAHHLLNGRWYRALCRGAYPPARVLVLAVDLLVFAAMLGLMVSGVMLSNHVFAPLRIRGGMSLARTLHMASSYWGFVLMALHLGLHWARLMGMAGRALQLRPSRPRRVALRVLGAAIAGYGLVAFVRRGLPTYMLLQTPFVFFDFGEPVALFYLDYLAMMGTFVWLGHGAMRLLRGRTAADAAGNTSRNEKRRV